MLVEMIPLMVGAAAVLHCFFLIALLLRLSSKLANRLLASILFFFAIRMGGCIAGLMYPNYELLGLYLGALSFALIGPLIYFYLHSLWSPSFQLRSKHYYQFSIAAPALFSLPILTVELAFGLYLLALLTMIIYVIAGIAKFKRASPFNRMDNMRWKWSQYFNSGIATLLILFLAQSFFFDALIYQGIIIGSALVLYLLTLLAVKQVRLFMYEPKKGKHHEVEELGRRIVELIAQEEIFTDPLMSIAQLADRLKQPPYLVSLAVNAYAEKSFPELITGHRIGKAEQLLTDPDKSHFTIETIAYESGFSTLSAFYTAFKRTTKKTPRNFRDQHLKADFNGISANEN